MEIMETSNKEAEQTEMMETSNKEAEAAKMPEPPKEETEATKMPEPPKEEAEATEIPEIQNKETKETKIPETPKEEAEETKMPGPPKEEAEAAEIPEIQNKETKETKIPETHERKPKKYYLAGILPIVFLAAAFLLFFMTEDLREKQEKEKEKCEYQAVLPEAETFETVNVDRKAAEEVLVTAGFSDVSLKQILEGKSKEQQRAGRIYELCAESGYGGNLTLLIGMNESEVLCGIEVKEAPEMVDVLTKQELDSFLEQFLYSRRDKVFWVDEQMFGGLEIVKMESAPVTSRKIVHMINGCRQLSDHLDTLVKGEEE